MKLAVNSSGQGPDVVFLHGWGLSSRIWAPLIAELSAEMRCHAVDLPGHGASGDDLAGLDAWIDAVAETVTWPAVYIGWSLGGLIALGMAQRYPDRVRGLCLIAALARMVRDDDWRWGLKPDAIEATRAGLDRDFATTLRQFLEQQVRGEADAATIAKRLRDDLSAQPPRRAGLAHGLDILFEADFRATLATMNKPSLLIGGERDRMAHPDAIACMSRQMPDAELWQVEGGAHAPFISHPRATAQRLRAFVDRLNA